MVVQPHQARWQYCLAKLVACIIVGVVRGTRREGQRWSSLLVLHSTLKRARAGRLPEAVALKHVIVKENCAGPPNRSTSDTQLDIRFSKPLYSVRIYIIS